MNKQFLLGLATILLVLFSIVHVGEAGSTPTRKWPDDISQGKAWVGYGIYVGLSLLFPFLFVFVMYNTSFYFWCCRCTCGLCGGAKPHYRGYTSRQVSFWKMIFLFFFIISGTLLCLATIFTIFFSTSIKGVQTESFKVVDVTKSRIVAVIENVNNTGLLIDEALAPIESIFLIVDEFNTSLNTMMGGLDILTTDVQDISNEVSLISLETVVLQDALLNISITSNGTIADYSSDVPDVRQIASFLNTSRDAIQNARDSIMNGVSTYNTLVTSMQNQVTNLRSEANGILGGMVSQVSGPMSSISEYIRIFDIVYKRVKYYVDIIDGVRLAVLIVFYVFMGAVLIMGLVGVCMNWPPSPRLSACCSFFTPFIFVVIALVQLFLFIGSTDICREFEPAVRRSQPIVDRLFGNGNSGARSLAPINMDMDLLGLEVQMSSNGISSMLNVSDIVDKVLYCSSEDSLLDIIPGLDLSLLNISKYIDPIRTKIDEQLDNFDAPTLIEDATQNLNNLTTIRSDVNLTDINLSLTFLFGTLDDMALFISNLTNLGYDESKLLAILDEVNTKSASIGGQYFELDNITLLIPSDAPYNTDQAFFEDRKTAILDGIALRDATLLQAEIIRINIEKSNSSLLAISSSVNSIITTLHDDTGPNQIRMGINSLGEVFKALQVAIGNAFTSLYNLISSKLNDILALTKCDHISHFYSASKKHVCQGISPSSGIIAISCFLLSVVGLVWFCFILPLTKKIGNATAENSIDRELSERY